MTDWENGAREFWIKEATEHTEPFVIPSEQADRLFGGDDFWKDRYLHVIEYAAFEKVVNLRVKDAEDMQKLQDINKELLSAADFMWDVLKGVRMRTGLEEKLKEVREKVRAYGND